MDKELDPRYKEPMGKGIALEVKPPEKWHYTEKKTTEIYHNHLIKDFVGIEKIVAKYL